MIKKELFKIRDISAKVECMKMEIKEIHEKLDTIKKEELVMTRQFYAEIYQDIEDHIYGDYGRYCPEVEDTCIVNFEDLILKETCPIRLEAYRAYVEHELDAGHCMDERLQILLDDKEALLRELHYIEESLKEPGETRINQKILNDKIRLTQSPYILDLITNELLKKHAYLDHQTLIVSIIKRHAELKGDRSLMQHDIPTLIVESEGLF